MMGPPGPRTYNLDGSETTGDTGRGKFARKATLSSDGKTMTGTYRSDCGNSKGTWTATKQ